MSDLQRSASFWDHEHAEPEFRTWMEHPRIRNAINHRIGLDRPMWPFDWFTEWSAGRVYRRALSLGCGTGALERDLVGRGLCHRVDALDVSITSVSDARKKAETEGFGDSLHYFVADFNRLTLPSSRYDLVLFHQSLHHVDALEYLLGEILVTLSPDGILFLDEYVGPSRTWWTPARFAPIRFIYDRLPESTRTRSKLPLPIHAYDPSEAIRSGEILSRVSIGFETIEERPYGGNVLGPIYPALQQPAEDLITGLIEQEEALLAAHGGSHYRIIVARPRTGARRTAAFALYRLLGAVHATGLSRGLLHLGKLRRRVWIAIDRRVRRRPIDHYT